MGGRGVSQHAHILTRIIQVHPLPLVQEHIGFQGYWTQGYTVYGCCWRGCVSTLEDSSPLTESLLLCSVVLMENLRIPFPPHCLSGPTCLSPVSLPHLNARLSSHWIWTDCTLSGSFGSLYLFPTKVPGREKRKEIHRKHISRLSQNSATLSDDRSPIDQ